MSIRFNQTSVSRISLITIPKSTKPIKPNISTPEKREEITLEEIEEKLEEMKEEPRI